MNWNLKFRFQILFVSFAFKYGLELLKMITNFHSEYFEMQFDLWFWIRISSKIWILKKMKTQNINTQNMQKELFGISKDYQREYTLKE